MKTSESVRTFGSPKTSEVFASPENSTYLNRVEPIHPLTVERNKQSMKRSLSILFSFTVVLAALLGVYLAVQPRVEAAPQAPGVSIDVAPTSLPADTTLNDCATGTPYAIHVTATGLDAATSYLIKAYHYSATDGNVNRGCMWNWQTNSWTVITNTYTGYPTVTGLTSWSGWIYLKEVSGHAGLTDLKLRVRLRVGTSNVADGTLSPTAYNTSTGGGWVSGHAYNTTGTLISGAPVVVRNGSAIVGVYATEDNVVDEGYSSGDTGYYRVAVPVGSGYTAEVWGSNNAITGTATTGVNVTAGATTANVDINVPDVTPPSVMSTLPANNAVGVSLYQPIIAVFNEALNATTVNTSTFTLLDANSSVAGTVGYDPGTRTTSFMPSAALAASTRYTATLTTGIQDLAGNPLAAPYSWGFTTGSVDTTPPTVVSHSPTTGAISVPLNSSIVITFSEELKPSTVISANFTLMGPSGSIGWSAFTPDPLLHRVTLTPIVLAAQSLHTVTISSSVTDWAGNPVAATSWSFVTSAELPMHAYHGDLHNHTSYSDGSLTAAQAYATGRANGFDFMAVTDHSYAVDDSEWANMLAAANNATIDGQFVALRGVEYTQGAEGHINVINSVRHAVRTNTGCAYCDYTPNLEKGVTVDGFYNWLSLTGTQSLDYGTIAQFNHPGWINFNDWTYHPEVSPTMKLEEVGNGSGTSYVFSEDEYIRSLDYGWKVGATNNADTHSPYWGSNTPHRTGVWMTGLTKADLLAALQARRTFATEDVNYELGLQGNGLWMGSEITNTNSIAFEVTGVDPDNEGGVLVQLITFAGEVVTQTTTASSNFTWNPSVPVTPGQHYYYVKVTQPDGDRIVTSPIWAKGDVDVALTDLVIEPTIASIYNPSLITARVTNRLPTTQTVTVTFQIPGVTPQALATTVPGCVKGPCVDGYANISWQPMVTGPVTITALLSGTPAGDNLEDNYRSTVMHVTDEHLPLILIDAAHGNVNAAGREMRMFVKDLSDHRYNILKNLAPFTAATLNTDTVKLLIITAPEIAYTNEELDAIAEYAATGGSLWICGLADYTGKLAWANTVADRLNAVVDRIETRTSAQINMRLNDDEVIDGNTNNGYVFGVEFGDFPGKAATGIGVNVESLATWSLSSIRGRLVSQPVTSSTLGVQIVVQGDLDAGYSSDFYRNPYHTSNTDADSQGDAYIYNPTWVYPATQPPGAIPLPMAAVTQLPNGGGRLLMYGDSNDGFGTFAYTAGDGKQNELFNLEAVMWLLGNPIQKSTIAQARAYDTVNQPRNLDRLVWIEGQVTAAFGEFFNVLYVQDETGGMTIHAPAGDISATQYLRGAQVRVLGTIGIYQGDTEVEFFEAEQVQILTPTNHLDPAPLPFSTHDASLESNQGWLTQITGTVTAKLGESVLVDDGSGPVRAFLDGYNGTWDDVGLFDLITVKGLISEDGEGRRIRVRNHGMHPLIPDDVTILVAGPDFSGSTANVTPLTVQGGELLTYTLTISNSGGSAGQFVLTNTLDAHVSLISAPNMTVAGSALIATGTLNSLATQAFTITVRANYGYSGTLSNTAQLSGDGFSYDLNTPAVQVTGMYRVYLPLILK
ncbi:hypothetical protein TFLX_02713 [Thermoflexales bacterium]|nr:hypothetical protein TFLX_02713 [Thermoflexales bacterium]